MGQRKPRIETVEDLSQVEKAVILAASFKPKRLKTILRHAKVNRTSKIFRLVLSPRLLEQNKLDYRNYCLTERGLALKLCLLERNYNARRKHHAVHRG